MFLWCIVAGLVLYFDGSLRAPRDVGFPTRGLGRMASVGAALYHHNGTLLTVGGKSLDIVPDITSADVEYEALLFGLTNRCLLDEWSDADDVSLIIRGDCKAIIDQLNGNSVPRKLRPKHELAIELLERIATTVSFEHVSFEHVPRKDNKLCDSICASVMSIMEQRPVTTFRKEMTFLTQTSKAISSRSVHPQSALMDLLTRFVSSDKSLVRYSLRPALYKEAVSVAKLLDDGMTLERIGRQLELESKLWPIDGEINKDLMTAQGILWQVQGLELLGNDKQAKRLLQKHRYILSRSATHDTITDMLDDIGGSAFVFSGHEINEFEAKTWNDQACNQDDKMLHDGYWITR